MPRPSNTAKRRAQIASGLLKVMAKRGYDGASVSDIAKTAGLTPGLVHYHFDSKREILLAALRGLVAGHGARLDERLARAQGDPIAEVAAFIDFHLGLGADADPETLACWILFSGEALRDRLVQAELSKTFEAIAARLRAVIQRGVEAKVFSANAIDAAASALVATIQGYFVLAATARSLIPKGSAASSTKQMAAGLLAPVRPFPRAEART